MFADRDLTKEDVAAIRKVLAGVRDVPAARHTLLTSLTPSSKAFERAFSGARFLENACVSGMTRRNHAFGAGFRG